MADDRLPRLLLVDDDEAQLTLYRKMLEGHFDVTATSSAGEGLRLLEQRDFDLLLSDYLMPEMTGVALVEKARSLRPAVRRVLMSAFTEAAQVLPAIDSGDVQHFVSKPVAASELHKWYASLAPAAAPEAVRCLVVAKDRGHAADVLGDLGREGFQITIVPALAADAQADLVLYVNPGNVHAVEGGIATLGRGRADLAIMVALTPESAGDAAGYFAAGVDDLVWLPLRPTELALRFQTWRSKREASRESERVRTAAISQEPFPEIIGRSPAMRRVFHQVHRVAPTDASILITGETGTGKEMIARVVHALSPRREGPFLAVNLSAIPETLVEAELFGHEKGAFTGAQAARKGRLEAAHGGTLFLDEIGDLSASIQVKLLRVLEERTFERLGSTAQRKAEFRLVCATHRNLEELVANERFREDLYYRINVVRIDMPPLRDRGDDVRLLAEHFVGHYAAAYGLRDLKLSDKAVQALLHHHWPGNVRELKHAIERAAAMSHTGAVLDEEVIWMRPARVSFRGEVAKFLEEEGRSLNEVLADLERAILVDTIQRCAGNQVAAARKLKIPRQTLQNRLKKYGL